MWKKESGRTSPLPKMWPAIRMNVLRRDNFQCVHIREDTGLPCGAYANQVDHIDDPNDHSHKNLQSLCEWHHNQKTGGQGGRAAAQNRQRRSSAPREMHPGFLPVDDE